METYECRSCGHRMEGVMLYDVPEQCPKCDGVMTNVKILEEEKVEGLSR